MASNVGCGGADDTGRPRNTACYIPNNFKSGFELLGGSFRGISHAKKIISVAA